MAKQKWRIWILDEDSDSRMFLCNLLQGESFQPIVDWDYLESATHPLPDGIVVNVMMGDEGTLSRYQQIKADARFRQVPVVMLAGIDKKTLFLYQRLQQKTSHCQDGPDAFVQTPYDGEQLLEILRELMEDKVSARNPRKSEMEE